MVGGRGMGVTWLGLDIGGANLKIADGRGFALGHPFELWRHPQQLTQQLRTLIAQCPPSDHLACTMTGELADCFENKLAGVTHIMDAVAAAADGRHTRVYTLDGKLVTPQVARQRPESVAAANWHALARYAARHFRLANAPEPSMLIDVGSTTCDIIPLLGGEPTATGRTDTERMIAGELLYTGVRRSPICAVVRELPYRDGTLCPVAHELFATTQDAYVLLRDLPEEPTYRGTADGQPLTKAHARTRLGRVLCADGEEFNHRDAAVAATAIAEAQTGLLLRAIEQVAARLPAPPRTFVLAGEGEFLAQRAIDKIPRAFETQKFSQAHSASISRCAPAHALAVLAREG